MFLPRTIEQNRRLVSAAVELHQTGRVPPGCFLIDTETVGDNTRLLAAAAAAAGVDLLFMSKQVGHHSETVDAVRRGGIDRAVAVDGRSAAILANADIPLGHVGHLSQVPRRQLPWLLAREPQVVTVFNEEQARAVAEVASSSGRVQDVMVKVRDGDGPPYPGQEGGLTAKELEDAARSIDRLPGLQLVGVTAYPCAAFDEDAGSLVVTPLFSELLAGAAALTGQLGLQHAVVNAPGVTSVDAIPLLADFGMTVGEPGHALTGTCPHHAFGLGPERPAIVYVSEAIQVDDGVAHAIGGGIYPRGRLQVALAGRDHDIAHGPLLPVHIPAAEFIDYHFSFDTLGSRVRVGDTVVCAFRPQAFVTYCRLASVTWHDGVPVPGPVRDNLGAIDRAWVGA